MGASLKRTSSGETAPKKIHEDKKTTSSKTNPTEPGPYYAVTMNSKRNSLKKEPTCNLGPNLPLSDLDQPRKNYQTLSIASDDSASISSDLLMASTSFYIPPSRYASISRRKACSRQLAQAQEYFEYVCSDDNASVSSLPIQQSDCMNGRKLSPSYSLTKLYSVPPHSLASILEDYLAEQHEQNCGSSESYFLPRKTMNKASKKWTMLESTGDFEAICETDLDEKTIPRCLDNKKDIFWF